MREFQARCRRLASALAGAASGAATRSRSWRPTCPRCWRRTTRVPMLGRRPQRAQLPARRRARSPSCLEHGEAKVLITDREFSPTIEPALAAARSPPLGDRHRRPAVRRAGELLGEKDYEAFLAEGDPAFAWAAARGRVGGDLRCSTPRARPATPRASSIITAAPISTPSATRSRSGSRRARVYLWTLPMFHCSGWTYTWAVTAVGGTHVCLRRVDPALIFPAIARPSRDAHVRRADRADHADPRARRAEGAASRTRWRWPPAAPRRRPP